jgi:hypothetical protein
LSAQLQELQYLSKVLHMDISLRESLQLTPLNVVSTALNRVAEPSLVAETIESQVDLSLTMFVGKVTCDPCFVTAVACQYKRSSYPLQLRPYFARHAIAESVLVEHVRTLVASEQGLTVALPGSAWEAKVACGMWWIARPNVSMEAFT